VVLSKLSLRFSKTTLLQNMLKRLSPFYKEKLLLNPFSNQDSWRIREAAIEELIYLTRKPQFQEDAKQTLFARNRLERNRQVKARIDSSLDTLHLRDARNQMMLTKEYRIAIENHSTEIEEQKRQLKKKRRS